MWGPGLRCKAGRARAINIKMIPSTSPPSPPSALVLPGWLCVRPCTFFLHPHPFGCPLQGTPRLRCLGEPTADVPPVPRKSREQLHCTPRQSFIVHVVQKRRLAHTRHDELQRRPSLCCMCSTVVQRRTLTVCDCWWIIAWWIILWRPTSRSRSNRGLKTRRLSQCSMCSSAVKLRSTAR